MKSSKILYSLLCITIFFNWWFPKAGIKISGIPLTIGLISFIILLIFFLMEYARKAIKISYIWKVITVTEFYFLFRMIIAYFCDTEIQDIAGYAMPLVFFPLIFTIVSNLIDDGKKYNKIMDILAYGFLFLCIYSIIQRIFGIAKTDIPGLTVNLSDYQEYGSNWFMQKNNGTNMENVKIVSTYQNGNLLGVNLIIFFPIVYEYLLVNKKGRTAIIFLALFIITILMTLSRACWIGLFIFLLLRIIIHDKIILKDDIIKKIFYFSGGAILIFIILKYVPSVADRILNTDFSAFIAGSGRTEGVIEFFDCIFNDGNVIINFTIGPYGFITVRGLAYEMTQIAVMKLGGIIGVILWCMQFFTFYRSLNKKNQTENSYRIAILMWFLTAIIEGGFWLLPTAINLYVLLGLGFSYKYNTQVNDEKEKEGII